MSYYAQGPDGINLQATLSAASACATSSPAHPHHPITCTSRLEFYEDGSFSCEHVRMPADDWRTQDCLNHTLALLVIEMATKL